MTKNSDRKLTAGKTSPRVPTRIQPKNLDLKTNRFECQEKLLELLELIHRQHPLTEEIHSKWYLYDAETNQPIYEFRLRVKPILKGDTR